MVFVVEISFYLHQHTNISSFKATLVELAERYGCETQYFMEEMRGHQFVSVHVVHFSSEITDAWCTCEYIKGIKKVRQVLIESVYYDEMGGQILYASNGYLKTMDRGARESFERGEVVGGKVNKSNKSNKIARERSYSESELLVLNALNKHRKSSKQGKMIACGGVEKEASGVKMVTNSSTSTSSVNVGSSSSSAIMSYDDYLGII
jgi:hypothetical protein